MGLESALSLAADWPSKLLAIDDERLIGLALAACSRQMFPYWESHNPRDDKMEQLVSAMDDWASNSTPELKKRILDSLRRVAVESHGWLSPVEPVPPGSDCPGDYAGDSIVAAANAITEIGRRDFLHRAKDCLESAAQTVAQTMGQQQPEDETTDFWTPAVELVRLGIINQLKDWERYAT